MSDVATPVERLADRVAAQWLLAHDRGLTAAEIPAFQAWLARSPANVEAWERANALWFALDSESDPTIDSMLTTARAMRPSIFSTAPGRIAAAAIVMAALGVGGLLMRQSQHAASGAQEVAERAPAFTRYAAGGALASVKLADGTGMVMDVGSEVDVRQSARRRDVRLTQGQVFFTVAHDPKRPFMVLAGHNVITDVGTAFAVAVQQKDTSVVLASGRVRVAHSGQAFEIVDLQPGQQFVQRDSRPGEVTSVDVDAKLAWRTGQMELDHTPLAEAVAQLNRHITTPISVGDAKAAALKLSGRYRLDDPQGFAQSIAAIYPVQVRSRRDGGIEIASR